MSVFAGEIVGVLAHVERADENGAGPLQSLNQRGVARRFGVVAVDPGASDGRDAFDIEQVLDRERHAGKRAEIASLAAGSVDCRGPGKGALDGNRCKGVELRIEPLDPRQRRLGDGKRAPVAACDGKCDL